MSQASKYDPKGLTMGILISLGAAGLSFLIAHYGLEPVLNTDLSCNTITENDWKKSQFHNQFNSLEEFIHACNISQINIDQTKIVPSILLPPVAFGIFFINWIRFGWHLKDQNTNEADGQ